MYVDCRMFENVIVIKSQHPCLIASSLFIARRQIHEGERKSGKGEKSEKEILSLVVHVILTRKSMRLQAAQRMASNKVVPREYVSWVMKQRGKRDHNPYDAPRYPSLHWKDYIEHEWPAQVASAEPQEPGYQLGRDGAPYAQYMNRKMSDALREHLLKQAAMAERIKQLQQQFGDVPAGGASGGDAEGGGVSKMVFDRKVRDMRVNQFEPSERDAVLDADSDGKLEHAMSARVDRAKAEAEAIAAAVKEGVKDAVEEVEEGMEKQEERMGEDVSRDVSESVAEAVSPVEGKVDRQSEEVSAQGKKIAEMRDRLDRIEQSISAAIPSAAADESSPSPPVSAPSSKAPAPSPVAPAAPPSVVSFSLPGKVTLPPGPYTFSIGNNALPLPAAPAADQSSPQEATSSSSSSPSSSSPDESSAPEVSPADEPSGKGEGEGGDDADDVLDTAVDLDNGVDGETVKAAAHDLMKKLIASATSDPAQAGEDDGDAPALSNGDDGVLDSFTGTSAGVDTDAVRAAAHALQERVIANAMGGGSAAASASSGEGDDVLDSSRGMHSGVDTAAVAAAAKDLQEHVIASVASGSSGGGGPAASGDDVLDSAEGMDTGVDNAAVVAAAHALQEHTIERTKRAGTGQQQAARGDDDVLDSVSGMDSGVDAKAVSKAALRLQREIAARLSKDLPK